MSTPRTYYWIKDTALRIMSAWRVKQPELPKKGERLVILFPPDADVPRAEITWSDKVNDCRQRLYMCVMGDEDPADGVARPEHELLVIKSKAGGI